MCVSSSFCFSCSGRTANHFVTLARNAQGSWKKPPHPRFKPIICKSCPSQRVEIFASVTNEDSSWGQTGIWAQSLKKEKKQSLCFCQWMWMWLVHVRPQTVSSCSEHEEKERDAALGWRPCWKENTHIHRGFRRRQRPMLTESERRESRVFQSRSVESHSVEMWIFSLPFSSIWWKCSVSHKIAFLSFKKYFLNLEWSES